MKSVICVLLAFVYVAFGESGKVLENQETHPNKIFCGVGEFPGHLQGIAADENGIYWSFYDTILKTDWAGKMLKKIPSPTHAGDLCIADGLIYVSVCYYDKKMVEREGGTGWLYVYDTELNFVKKIGMPEVPRPDGIVKYGQYFYVANDDFGHDPHPFNYITVMDKDFKVVKKVKVDFGMQTQYGAQTLNVIDGKILASFYGDNGHSPLLIPETLELLPDRFCLSPSVGFAKVPASIAGADNVYIEARNYGERGKWTAFLNIYKIANLKKEFTTLKKTAEP